MFKELSKVTVKRSWYIAFFLTIVGIIISWNFFDKPVVDFFYPRDDSFYFPISSFLTDFGEAGIYLVGSLLLYLFWRKGKPLMARAALFVFTTTAVAGIITNILKVIFGRARPKFYYMEDKFGLFWFETESNLRSIPSGHTTTAIGVWLAFALLFPRFRWPLIVIGLMLALTRVILTHHYVSDVIAGGFVGAMTTLVLYELFYPQKEQKS